VRIGLSDLARSCKNKNGKQVSPACRELTYVLNIKSPAPSEKVQELLQMIEKGCHTLNSLRNPVPVSGKLIHNGKEFAVP
jgi:hypothetical protein